MADPHLGQSNTDHPVEEKSAAQQGEARHTSRPGEDEKPARGAIRARSLPIMLAGLILIILFALWLWPREKEGREASEKTTAGIEAESNEVALTPEAIKTAGIEIGQVSERPAVARLSVAGEVEANA